MSEHEPRPGPGGAPGEPQPPATQPTPTAEGQRARRDPAWDPPTVVYMPDGRTASGPEALLEARQASRGQRQPEPTMRSAVASRPDDPTVAVPGKAPAGGPDDPTLVRPPAAYGGRGIEHDPTLRRGPEHDPTIKRGPEHDPTIKRGPEHDPTIKRGPEHDPTLRAQPRGPGVVVIGGEEEEQEPRGFKGTVRWLLHKHGSKLWWLHTAYALSLGAFVVMFAQKGFAHARWLAITLGVAWLVVMLFFRIFGTGARQDFATAWRGARLRFLVMTYVLKNLYQGMLFFLLPFYWKSASLDAPNRWFVLLLGVCAVVSTLDLVFDRVLMRWKFLASIFYGVTLFGCLNLVIPALLPNTRTLWTLLSAAGIAVLAFTTLHLPLGALRHPAGILLLVGGVGGGVGLAYSTRGMIPPVPMHLSTAAVGPETLPDGRLAMEVKALHTSVIQQLLAVTDVVVPGGKGDRLRHVWRREGMEIYRASEEASRVAGPEGAVRLRSSLGGKDLPARLVGRWSVDVETEDGQLVGRVAFEVTE